MGRRLRFPTTLMLALAAATTLGTFGCRRHSPLTYATIETDLGRITCLLYEDLAPNAVAVFAQFARGELPFMDPRQDFRTVQQPLYNDTTFYLVQENRLVEGGDPGGDGATGPGVQFAAQLTPNVYHDRPGLLGMVPYGEGKYGSQFYITLAPMPQFDGTRVVFGEVVSGLEVVRQISQVPATERRPNEPVRIRRVLIVRR